MIGLYRRARGVTLTYPGGLCFPQNLGTPTLDHRKWLLLCSAMGLSPVWVVRGWDVVRNVLVQSPGQQPERTSGRSSGSLCFTPYKFALLRASFALMPSCGPYFAISAHPGTMHSFRFFVVSGPYPRSCTCSETCASYRRARRDIGPKVSPALTARHCALGSHQNNVAIGHGFCSASVSCPTGSRIARRSHPSASHVR